MIYAHFAGASGKEASTMLQLLIVDDERVAVEAIRQAIPWETLGITGVFEAFNIKKAKEILLEKDIDIMLCDIEMPQGSGLDLLEWVHLQKPRVVTIFLTCHANFDYVKKAMKFGSLDYILKPLPYDELSAAIARAIDKIKKENELAESSEIREAWKRNQPLLIENFWLDVVGQSIPSNPRAIYEAAAARKIALPDRAEFWPTLIKVRKWNKEFNKRDIKILDYAFRNAGEEILLKVEGLEEGYLVDLGHEDAWLVIQTFREPPGMAKLLAACRTFIQACKQYFYCDVCCYIGEPVAIDKLPRAVEKLLDYDFNNVTVNAEAITVREDPFRTSCAMNIPDMTTWGILLQKRAKDQVLSEIRAYLSNLSKQKGINKTLLRRFQHNFMQMIYSVLKEKGIQAYELYNDPESMQLYSRANRSIDDLATWVEHTLDKAASLICYAEQDPSVVQRVIHYIRANLDEDLSRDLIADWIGLNPDYLTRLFKKETGQTIVDFISNERVERAKELLAKTDMPISMIASSVGYHNFSHFSQMFKKNTSMTPGVYRLRFRSLNGATATSGTPAT